MKALPSVDAHVQFHSPHFVNSQPPRERLWLIYLLIYAFIHLSLILGTLWASHDPSGWEHAVLRGSPVWMCACA